MQAFDRRTDERTDERTDGRTDTFLITSSRWHSMQRGRKLLGLQYTKTCERTEGHNGGYANSCSNKYTRRHIKTNTSHMLREIDIFNGTFKDAIKEMHSLQSVLNNIPCIRYTL